MTNEQMEKRWAFADALATAIKASEGVKQGGWDTPISYIVDAMKRGVSDYGRGRLANKAALAKASGESEVRHA